MIPRERTKSGPVLALFDLDGTITTSNVFLDFLRFAAGHAGFYARLAALTPLVLLHYAGLIGRGGIKTVFVSAFFRGRELAELKEEARTFQRTVLPTLIRGGALERLEWHRKQGHRVVVISACIDFFVAEWCRDHGIDLISTEAAVERGRLTGRLKTADCSGPEKVRRLRAVCDLSQVSYIYAYGDTESDAEMLALADEGYFQKFH